MADRGPVPLAAEGIDVRGILDGSCRPAALGYSIDAAVTLRVDRRCVDDDGTFVPPHGNIMIRFHIHGTALTPFQAVRLVRSVAQVSLGPIYLYAPDPETAGTRFEVVAFFSADRTQIDAPPNFDWQRKATRHPGSYTVYRSVLGSDHLVDEYRSPNARFYQPHMDNRGTFWDLRVTAPPENSGLGSSFASALAALSRKGAVRSDLQPLGLEWVCDTTVAFTFRRTRTDRRYRLELHFPTDEQMRTGRFILPGGMMRISEPDQFAAGLISMLFERSAFSPALFGTECEGNRPGE